jgi:hypothetical protein
MPAPKTLTLYRRDTRNRALITLSGETDLDSMSTRHLATVTEIELVLS